MPSAALSRKSTRPRLGFRGNGGSGRTHAFHTQTHRLLTRGNKYGKLGEKDHAVESFFGAYRVGDAVMAGASNRRPKVRPLVGGQVGSVLHLVKEVAHRVPTYLNLRDTDACRWIGHIEVGTLDARDAKLVNVIATAVVHEHAVFTKPVGKTTCVRVSTNHCAIDVKMHPGASPTEGHMCPSVQRHTVGS